MALCARLGLLFVVLVVLGCTKSPKEIPTAAVNGSGRGAASSNAAAARATDDLAAWSRALAILDTGDLKAGYEAVHALDAGQGRSALLDAIDATSHATRPRSHALANATITHVGKLPEALANAKAAPLFARRVQGPKGHYERADERRYSLNDWSYPGASDDESVPTFVPRRIGERSLRRLRPSDGRWLAIYNPRHVAVLSAEGELVALLDFSAWSESVEWGELSGDTLFVSARGTDHHLIAAIAVSTGAILWRSEDASFVETFACGTDRIIAWVYGEKNGAILALDRKTGRTIGRRATPEIEIPNNPHIVVIDNGAKSVVAVYQGSSSSSPSPYLKDGEYLEVSIKVPPKATTPPEPIPAAVQNIPPSPIADPSHVRLDAWALLDKKSDPRRAILTLRPRLETDPTNFVASALLEGAIHALRTARADAGKAIMTATPIDVPDDAPSGDAPVKRSRTRTLKVVAQRPLVASFAAIEREFPKPSDDLFLAPAWVPDFVGPRRRDPEASSVTGTYRIEVFKGYHTRSLVVTWRDAKLVSLLDVEPEVRFADAQDGVVFLTVLEEQKGRFHLDARDAKTGRLYWRVPNVHDQYSVFEGGYIVASTAASQSSSAEILLIEADTGKIAGRPTLVAPQDAFLIVRKDSGILAINTKLALDLSLE